MGQCKTAVTPLLTQSSYCRQWSYCSLALSHDIISWSWFLGHAQHIVFSSIGQKVLNGIVMALRQVNFLSIRNIIVFQPLETWWHHMAQAWMTNTGSGIGLLPDGTKPLPEPILTYRCVSEIINWTLKNRLQRNSNHNSMIVSQENAYESVVCKMWANCWDLNVLISLNPVTHPCVIEQCNHWLG